MKTRYKAPGNNDANALDKVPAGDDDDANALDKVPGDTLVWLTDWVVDFGLKVEVFKSVYRKRFNRNSVVHMCVWWT